MILTLDLDRFKGGRSKLFHPAARVAEAEAFLARRITVVHLPRQAEHGRLRVKNGPALAGHGAEAVRDAITSTIAAIPDQLRRSLTWDQGAEMAQHAQLRIDSGLHVFFCDPRSPWQRATNENTNGLLRQYFPKGTDLSRHSARDIAAVAATLNRRPRKTLSWRTPSEVFNELPRISDFAVVPYRQDQSPRLDFWGSDVRNLTVTPGG